MTDTNEPSQDHKETEEPSKQRRNFLKTTLAVSAVLLVAGIAGIFKALSAPAAPVPSGSTTTTQSGSGFPRVKVGTLGGLSQSSPVQFNYPLEETPNMLVKLGQKVTGGIGPDGDIVAYSMVCQHLGCIYGYVAPGDAPACNAAYKASGPIGYCCCHGTVYDLADAGKVVSGPSPRAVPQVILELDSSTGDIYATGMTPPTIFGHDTGSNDVSADLQGGTIVS